MEINKITGYATDETTGEQVLYSVVFPIAYDRRYGRISIEFSGLRDTTCASVNIRLERGGSPWRWWDHMKDIEPSFPEGWKDPGLLVWAGLTEEDQALVTELLEDADHIISELGHSVGNMYNFINTTTFGSKLYQHGEAPVVDKNVVFGIRSAGKEFIMQVIAYLEKIFKRSDRRRANRVVNAMTKTLENRRKQKITELEKQIEQLKNGVEEDKNEY